MPAVLTDPAGVRRGPFRADTVRRMLPEPDGTRTTLGSSAPERPALSETELQETETRAR